jgi:hypothetical protein
MESTNGSTEAIQYTRWVGDNDLSERMQDNKEFGTLELRNPKKTPTGAD